MPLLFSNLWFTDKLSLYILLPLPPEGEDIYDPLHYFPNKNSYSYGLSFTPYRGKEGEVNYQLSIIKGENNKPD